jgi:hypothetical protein
VVAGRNAEDFFGFNHDSILDCNTFNANCCRNCISDDNHLPLPVSIPEGKAYNVTNQEIYNKTVTVFFLVDHDWFMQTN